MWMLGEPFRSAAEEQVGGVFEPQAFASDV